MWFSKSVSDTLSDLNSAISSGLSANQVEDAFQKFGPNKLESGKKKTVLQMFLAQLSDWLIYILFAAVLVTFLMGEYIDAVIIILVILTNASIGVFQEMKAGNAVEAIMKMSSPKALVRRNGEVNEIASEQLVPGDIVVLDAGRIVPADLRLAETVNLQIEESALTGESVPTTKNAAETFDNPQTPVGDLVNMAFMSSIVTSGRGVGIVVETGMNTEVGKIADSLEANSAGKAPLEIRLNELGKMLGKIAIGICTFIFIVSWLQGRDLAEMFLTAVSLAVASIPEGLAAIVAVVLSVGVTSMTKKHAIIRRLAAVETLGSVNIICSDKTGTLTKNEMTVTEIFTLDGTVLPEKFDQEKIKVSHQILVKGMVLCSDAELKDENKVGDPTEIALLDLADKMGINRQKLAESHFRKDEKAFDSERKMMSVLVKHGETLTVYTKGALGSIFEKTTGVLTENGVEIFTEAHRKTFSAAAGEMSDAALRTLALAYKEVDHDLKQDEMESDLILVGITGMIDPAREEVKPAIISAKNAGITTVMITGDHKNTAFAIAKDLGISDNPQQVITGQEMDALSAENFLKNAGNYRVFARVSPEHKVRIVSALKERGNIVSMTGDGVNDAPSLEAADIGVAMGITGTDVAKGAADMILTDDNFATIVAAIEQGRNIYNNIRKSVIFLLTCNLGEVVAMFLALVVGWNAPLIATQLLWINLITDSLPAIALGLDEGDRSLMDDRPRAAGESFFANGIWLSALLGGLMIGLITFGGFWYGHCELGYSPFGQNVPEDVLANARTMAFMILVFSQLLYAFGMQDFKKTVLKTGIWRNKYLVAAVALGMMLQVMVLFVPFLREAFKLHLLDANAWIASFALSIIPLVLHELGKVIFPHSRFEK